MKLRAPSPLAVKRLKIARRLIAVLMALIAIAAALTHRVLLGHRPPPFH